MADLVKSQLLMARNDLSSLQNLELPEGYHLRSFQPGDEGAWESIINESFQMKSSFQQMDQDSSYRPERVLFICDRNKQPIATASAWFRDSTNEDTGYLHMVGVLMEHTGKRLGYYVSLAALYQMAHEGRKRAILNTDDFRIPAIKTYLKLDFIPEFAAPGHEERWKDILQSF